MLPRQVSIGYYFARNFLQQLAELLGGQSCISYNSTESKAFDRVIPRDDHLAVAIAHHDVFALADDLEVRLLQSAYSRQMIDSGNIRHG